MSKYSFSGLFWREKKLITLALLFMACLTAVSIIIPLIMKYLIDIVVPSYDLGLLKKIVFVILITYSIEILLSFGNRVLILYITKKIQSNLRCDLLERIMYSNLEQINKVQMGKLKNVINRDTHVIGAFLGKNVLPLFLSTFNFVAIGVTIWILNWRMTLVALAFTPIYYFLYSWVGKRLEKAVYKYYEAHDHMAQTTLQCLTGMETIKAFGKEKYEVQHYQKASGEYVKSETIIDVLEAIANSVSMIFGKFISMGFFVYSIILIFQGQTTLGVAVAFFTFVSALYAPIRQISEIVLQRKRTLESYNRVREYLDLVPQVSNVPNPLEKNSIDEFFEFKDVYFGYNPYEYILKNINFKVKRNSTIALVGKSGSGKSTIARLLLRFYDVDKGSISIDGVNIKNINLHDLRGLIGYVGQDNFLFNKTIKENILYGCNEDVDEEELLEVCRKVNLHGFITNLEDGFNTVVGERGVKLSGGEKQRISIARALLGKPQLVILDEATSHLDRDNENIIQESINELAKYSTLIIIAHRLSSIKEADIIYVLQNGAITESGTHEQLLILKKEYFSLWNKQKTEEPLAENNTA